MPHHPHSPSSTRAGSDDNSDEAAQRKKKNADAQAAFRARRANYIATLEAAVTNLENVVITLQASWREAKNEAALLRTEVNRLRNEARDREKFWRALWQTRKTGMPPDPSDESCLPSYAQSQSSPEGSASSVLLSPTATLIGHPQDPQLRYSGNPSAPIIPPSQQYMSSSDYLQRSPALGYASAAAAAATPAQTEAMGHPQSVAHGAYSVYVGEEASREDSWSPAGACTGREYNTLDGSQSPTLVDASSMPVPDMPYSAQYSASIHTTSIEASYTSDQHMYLFSPSRSVSPALTQASTASSTSISMTSTSAAPAPYQFTFPEGSAIQDRPEFAFRRHITLQGGTANVAVAGTMGDVLRHKLANRGGLHASPDVSATRPHPESSYHEDEPYQPSIASHITARQRHNVTPEALSSGAVSRSPSPGPKISGTLAIIKAQAFGALRRTRGKTRTSSEGLAKAAVDALSSHGLGLDLASGPPSKRQRTRKDNDEK